VSQHQTGFSVVLGIGQKNYVLMIASRAIQAGTSSEQSGAELGSLKYEK